MIPMALTMLDESHVSPGGCISWGYRLGSCCGG